MISSGGPTLPLLSRSRHHDKSATIQARASSRSQRTDGAGWQASGSDAALKCDGASCGELLADKFCELFLSEKKRRSMQRTWTTRSDLAGSVHDREADLGQNHEARDPISVCLAVLGFCSCLPVPAVRLDRHVSLWPESASASCRRGRRRGSSRS